MHAIALLMLLAASPVPDPFYVALEGLQRACGRDSRSCADYAAAKAAKATADNASRQSAELQAEVARLAEIHSHDEENSAKAEAEEAALAKLQKKCGEDYHRVQVGMSFARVLKCSADFPDAFSLKYEDQRAKVYESEAGMVRVENGKITRTWHAN